MAEAEPEQIANRIRTFAERVDNRDDWRIVVPRSKYTDVKGALDTTKDLTTYYRGIALCYGDGEETQVKLKTGLSGYLDTLNAENGGNCDE